ncbi:serine/threonine-protein kinase [Actinophytocola sediminis]
MAQDEARLVAGRYRLVEPLGRGGMGVVWRAHDELLHRVVAVKEVHLRFGLAEQAEYAAARSLREARAAAGLRHPGIVAVHDVVIENGQPLIVMELVAGQSLAEVVRGRGLSGEAQVAAIARQVLDALRAAHAAGILHRDVKPANILLDGDRAVLTDFGIAAVSGATALTETNALVGSPEYLAPERVNGQPATEASDLWSVGVTLCVLLRGESPFQREDTQSTLAAVLTYDPPPDLSAGRLWPVIEGLLRKDPAHRLTSGAAMELLGGGVPTTTLTPVASPRSRRRHRIVALLAVFLLVVGGAVTWVLLPTGETAADQSPPSGSPSGSVSDAPGAPPGFTRYEDPAGYSLAVPRGWYGESYEQETDWSAGNDQRNTLWIHVEWQDDAEPNASQFMLAFERGEFSASPVSEYQRLRFSPGMRVAELECVYQYTKDGATYAHDLLRTIITESGRRYTLTLAAQTTDGAAATEAMWQDNLARITTILKSFQVES